MDENLQKAPPTLIAGLLRPEAYPHPTDTVRLEETHISWVLLTGEWAYKLKKPVDLGFLDFSTLEKRRHFCEEELRLNRRLAAELYDSVVAIAGNPEQPRVGGAGPILDYAVKMRQFPQDALASRLLSAGLLTAADIDRLADTIAAFHHGADRARSWDTFGSPQSVAGPVRENFQPIRETAIAPVDQAALNEIEGWTIAELERLRDRITQRRADGRVRECHGDLHLGNIVRIKDRLVPFDCIEFSPALRFIDVMSEAAFLAMDLAHRQRPDFAYRALNRYLEATGDYEGLDLLPFYWVYRALVRAKIHAIRAAQLAAAGDNTDNLLSGYRSYIGLASRFTQPRRAALVITHGLSGSGKTTASQSLLETLGAFRVRSDVERKHLHGLPPLAVTHSGTGAGIYSPAANTATYERLYDRASSIVQAGFPAIVDAAFLKRAERDQFRELAAELAVPFVILHCTAPEAVLRERVAGRARRADDASEADDSVLARQIANEEPLAADERGCAVTVNNVAAPRWSEIVARLRE